MTSDESSEVRYFTSGNISSNSCRHSLSSTLAPLQRYSMTLNHVAEPVDGSGLVVQLASRYFRPGGIVKGVVRLVSHPVKPDAYSEIAYVVAQVHGHVTVDNNLLPLPVAPVQSPQSASKAKEKEHEWSSFKDMGLPDLRHFSGTKGTCIFCSTPSVLFSDINIAPTRPELEATTCTGQETIGPVSLAQAAREDTTERCTREFAIALPKNSCPSFRGLSAKVFYVVSITVQCAMDGSKPGAVHLPFNVYGSEYYFEVGTGASASRMAEASPHKDDNSTPLLADKSVETTVQTQQVVGGTTRVGRLVSVTPAAVGVRKGSEIAFDLRPSLMHGRVETELMQRTQTSIFTIGKDNSHLVRFLLTKQFYQPGEVLLGIFDFTRASIPCYEVSATLCFEETLSSMALDPGHAVQSKVYGSCRERTLDSLQTNVRFSIPHDALPTIKTDLVRFQWLLRFEFSAGAPSSNGITPQRQSFQWHVPIVVQPAVATQRNQLANVPHKFYSGSTCVASLSKMLLS